MQHTYHHTHNVNGDKGSWSLAQGEQACASQCSDLLTSIYNACTLHRRRACIWACTPNLALALRAQDIQTNSRHAQCQQANLHSDPQA